MLCLKNSTSLFFWSSGEAATFTPGWRIFLQRLHCLSQCNDHPCPSESYVRSGKYYGHSFSSEPGCLEEIIHQDMAAGRKSNLFRSTEMRPGCVETVSVCKQLRTKFWQGLSVDISDWKRKTWKFSFNPHDDRYLFSRHLRDSDEQKQRKTKKIEKAKAKFILNKTVMGEILDVGDLQTLRSFLLLPWKSILHPPT